MNIFVCIKQVPDTETKLKIAADGNGIDTNGIKWIMNPYDEFAVEEALKLKESKTGTVTVFSVGPAKRVAETLRTALAMGADNATVIDAPEGLDTLTTAQTLAAAIRQEGPFDLILTGKVAIDDNAASVSQMLAEILEIPHTTVVSKLEFADQQITVEREIEGGSREIVQLKLPAIVGANKGLNMPRYASLPGIMKAKKKPIKELTLAALNVATDKGRIRFTRFQLPPEKPPVKLIEGSADQQAHQLVQLLHNEAKVL
jgi:electron transfer flavoprotein beta subunit